MLAQTLLAEAALQQHHPGGYRRGPLVYRDFYAWPLNHRFFVGEDALDLSEGPLNGVGLLGALGGWRQIGSDFLHGLSDRKCPAVVE